MPRHAPKSRHAVRTKDLPEGPGERAPEGSAKESAAARSERPVPLMALPGFTLFPGTLVPLSAIEPEPCRTLAASLADRRLLVIAALDTPGPERAIHAVAGLGRIVSDRRHPDGRMDAFVHGLSRVRLGEVLLGPDGLAAPVEALPDEARKSTSEAGLRLLSVATTLACALADRHAEEAEALSSLVASSEDLGLIANRLAAMFVEPFAERQRLLEERCPAERADAVAAVLGEVLLASDATARVFH